MQQNHKHLETEEVQGAGMESELTDSELSTVFGGQESKGASGFGPIPGFGIPSFGSGIPGVGTIPGLPGAAGQSAAAPGTQIPSLSTLLGMIAS
jgi:hypothetical protein